MKTINDSSRLWKIMVALSLAWSFAVDSHAQSVPSLINYQGKLTDQNGNPLATGVYGIQFRIWDSATATNGSTDLIWGQQQNATVQTNGVFNLILGSPGGSPISGTTPLVNSLAYAFTGSNCFLGVTIVVSNGTAIASPGEILPRQQLLSVPFAVQAQQASSLLANYANTLSPPGSVIAFCGTNIPAGWLLCDGSLINRTTFTNLYSAIGTGWGAGDGSTTFNLPDLRGMFLRGIPDGRNDSFASDPETQRIPGSIESWATGMAKSGYTVSYQHYSGDIPLYNGYSLNYSGSSWPIAQDALGNYAATISGGDSETRPVNAGVNYIIKY
jgi:hypothetical protein